MERREEGDGHIIQCDNLQCASNGGTNASRLLSSLTPESARNGNRPIEPSDGPLIEGVDFNQVNGPEMCGACLSNLRMDAMKLAIDSFHTTPTTPKLIDRAESIFYWILAED